MSYQLNYSKSGTGENLILLHGLLGSGRNLDSLSRGLRHKHTVYSLDLRNHGQSFHDEVMDYLLMAEDVQHFCHEQNINAPVVIGHSMGGKVAMVNALLDPGKTAALIVLDIAPVNYKLELNHILDILVRLDLSQIDSRAEADKLLANEFKSSQFRQFIIQNMVRDNDGFRWRLNLQAISNNLGHITGFPDLSGKKYPGPCLFLGGENSDFIQADHTSVIRDYFPASEVRKIADAGHWLHAEKTDQVLEEIRGFLQKNPE